MCTMALKFEIDSLEGVDSSLHAQYKKTDTGYRLDIDGLEDTGGLKTALQKERESNKDAKTKLAELERQREDAEKKVLEEQGKFKELSMKDREDKLLAEQKLNDLQRKISEQQRSIMVRELASSMTADSVELDIIVKFSSDYVSIDGEEVKFIKPIEEIKTEMSRFIRSKANGSNDGGNNKGGSQAGKAVGTKQEQLAYIKNKFKL